MGERNIRFVINRTNERRKTIKRAAGITWLVYQM